MQNEPAIPLAETTLADEAATGAFARALAPLLCPGDTVLLEGPLGAGKTALARAMIRCLCDEPDLDVPSPTFALVQVYETGESELWHLDLYRLEAEDDILDLGFEEAAGEAICLVEWPDRAAPFMPADALRLAIRPPEDAAGGDPAVGGLEKRRVTLAAAPAHSERWRDRLAPLLGDAKTEVNKNEG